MESREILMSAEACADQEVLAGNCSSKNFSLEHTKHFLGNELAGQLIAAIHKALDEMPELDLAGDSAGRGRTNAAVKEQLCLQLSQKLWDAPGNLAHRLLQPATKAERNKWLVYQTVLRIRRDRKQRRASTPAVSVAAEVERPAGGGTPVPAPAPNPALLDDEPLRPPWANVPRAPDGRVRYRPHDDGRPVKPVYMPVGVVYRVQHPNGLLQEPDDLIIGSVEDWPDRLRDQYGILVARDTITPTTVIARRSADRTEPHTIFGQFDLR
ncbi:hypothetical protein TWF696_008616 [Orbilia brochopaga]|uniref:Uncharacterized protein n=1 Tax=Orbilia brochopaga TaxID=3140254 RepID=A0AAV9UGP1_9PEZI